ncbi:hypothetical protein PMAYCL1PPCAC_11210, partial [Pristionchus mayeri]
RWLHEALSSLIRSQFNDASYSRFLAQADYIARVGGAKELPEGMKGRQKRLVLLPTLTHAIHVEVDEQLFPGASVSLSALFGLDPNRSTTCLTASGITVYERGRPISLDSIAADSVLIWQEGATGQAKDFGTALPRLEQQSKEHAHSRCVHECYELDRQCYELIEAYCMAVSIAKRNVGRVIAWAEKLEQWLRSIDRNEKHAATTATVASVMDFRDKEMLNRLQPCIAETAARREEVRACADAARQLAACVSRWTVLDDRSIANWHDSLRDLSSRLADSSKLSNTEIDLDIKWANTLKKEAQNRLAELEADAANRVKEREGIAHVIRNVVALDEKLSRCVRKMKETASIVCSVADQARERVAEYVQNTTGMDEAVIRRNLTNSVYAFPMLQINLEKQVELVNTLQDMRLEYTARGSSGSSHSH